MDTSNVLVTFLRAKDLNGIEQIWIRDAGNQEQNKWNKLRFLFKVEHNHELKLISLSSVHIKQLNRAFGVAETSYWMNKPVNVKAIPRQIEGKQQLTFEFLPITERIEG